MKTWRVRYARPAAEDLRTILDHVAERVGVDVAEGFVSRLQRACESLATAPPIEARRAMICGQALGL